MKTVIGTLFDYAEMVFLDRPYCELKRQGKNKGHE